ncbi:hypothetical protein BDB00DRAFT_876371 [Zychaea mexicana]|uniref:uncharacterized protein n=1 Tax=Zychaea mexicana TaxID=64656 RepID=UPI0022FEEBE0|nr:uncharacterized protein BDB00DRAFT_876371 [Zychaea mexicana]KAI9489497.1 hypothetical protein BDB00DRAFT_876371 [Zychaea mexicana]
MASVQRQGTVVPAGSPIPNARTRTTTTTTNDYNSESTITKKDDTHSSNNTVTPGLTVTQRRAERTITVRISSSRVLWQVFEANGMLAGIYNTKNSGKRIPAPPPSLPLPLPPQLQQQQQEAQAQATPLLENDASFSGFSSSTPLPSSMRCPKSISEPASPTTPTVRPRDRCYTVNTGQQYHQQTEEDGKQRKGRAVSSRERHRMTEDRAREMELKNEELHMLIQGLETKMKRANLRFQRNKARHEESQERRQRRIIKYQDALGKLALPSTTTFVAPRKAS